MQAHVYEEDRPMTELLRDAAAAALDTLAEHLDGDLYRPGDADWDEARTAWNLAVDQRPAAVVAAESAADVSLTIRAARAEGLRVAPQGTGHAAAAIGDLSGTILLRTTRMRRVDVDPHDRRARVEAGVIWQEVTDAAAEHGLAGLAGSSHDVGVFGYALGGGLSWLARKHGLAANTILAAEIVDAEGRIRRIDAESDPELFWAIRGGGGSFAIVTALELRLFPIAEVVAGVLFFPIERASEVLNAWLEWTKGVPEEVTSCGRIMRFPPFPEVPEPLRGNAFALVEAVVTDDLDAADDLLAPLRALGPAMDTFRRMPARELSTLHMDPPNPVPGVGDGLLLGSADADTVAAIVASAGADSGSSLLSVEMRQLGGALDRRAPGDGAATFAGCEYAVFAVGIAATPELYAASERDSRRVVAALEPWDSGRDYMNFRETRSSGARLFSAEIHERLRAIKRRVDPRDLIRSNHPVRPATASNSRG
jgi:FAD binding domain-containing protein/berberine-like enzyme